MIWRKRFAAAREPVFSFWRYLEAALIRRRRTKDEQEEWKTVVRFDCE
jgi:hypothetical protein